LIIQYKDPDKDTKNDFQLSKSLVLKNEDLKKIQTLPVVIHIARTKFEVTR
jgi:hypothetical protein